MIRLAIDTATKRASVALSISDIAPPIEVESRGEQSHYEELPELVGRAFDLAGVSIEALQEIVVGEGPGSFTGLRIGYGFVVGLALGLGIPVRQVSTLAAIAAGAWADGVRLSGSQARITAVLDARRGELFAQTFSCDEAGPALADARPAEIVPQALLAERLAQSLVVGELEVAVVEGLVPLRRLGLGLLIASRQHAAAPAAYSVNDLSGLRPNYLRAVAARTIVERSGA